MNPLLLVIVILIVMVLPFCVSETKKNKKEFSASFGKLSNHLSIFNCGYSPFGGLYATTREQAFRGLLGVGSTGSGKTSSLLTSSLFTLNRKKCSTIILDIGGLIYKTTSGYLGYKKNRKIYVWDLGSNSDGFNAITICKDVDDINRMVHTLVINSEVVSKNDQYWSSSCELILGIIVQYLFFYAEEQYKNMANVVLLLETYLADPSKLDILLVRSGDLNLLRSYKSFNAIPERTRSSIVSVALTATKVFKSPSVARCTALNTFDISSFRKTPSILYLCIPLNMVSFLAPLSAILFETLFQEMLSKIPSDDDLDAFFCIDEMTSMRLDLARVFPQCRRYRMGCMALIQDLKMLQMHFNEGECFAIKSNCCCHVYLPPQSLPTCKELQELLGKEVVLDSGGHKQHRYLMEAAEIRTQSDAIALINTTILKASLKPFYKHFIYRSRTKLPPYSTDRKIPFDVPPFIPLP